MNFLESYKRLDILCRDCLRSDKGITDYIEEMGKNGDGTYFVPSWHDDLQRLRKYRQARNRIVHEPDCCEEDVCSEEDIAWIEEFHQRLLTQADPLTICRIEKKKRLEQAYARIRDTSDEEREPNDQSEMKQKNAAQLYWLGFLVIAIFYVVYRLITW